jgi:uncharacterized RDD family membrane protein YckC
MSSAQLDLHTLDEATTEMGAATPFGLKEQAAERLAAHRARRSHPGGPVTPIAPATPAKASAARIAAAVAERYAHSQSYRAFLAAEAEAAIRKAEAAAEVAALTAQAVADAQYQLLTELDQWALTPPPLIAAAPVLLSANPEAVEASSSTEPFATIEVTQASAPHTSAPGLTVKLYEDVIRSQPEHTHNPNYRVGHQPFDEAEALALDEEIAFRQSPVFEELGGSPIDIPANLIEFPRQLVAARKARPRLAEGPLREDVEHTSQKPETAQLRIFEVEAAQISTAPIVESIEPEWSSILLAALPPAAAVESTEPLFSPILPPQAATLNLRLMAGIVDACIVLASLLVFTAIFAITDGHLSGEQIVGAMPLQVATISVVAVFGFLIALYHLLFFTFAEATPGMRYARIGLCTFSDENPTRSAMRRRLFSMALSACPLGIGFLWACLDDDRLGWHDRISRMYQRSY